MANGIKDKSSYVSRVAKDIIEKANRAARDKAKVNSPSKLFALIGEAIDEGLVKGMVDKEPLVIKQTRSLVDNMAKGSAKALDTVAELMNSNMIDDPVIKPVLDLSDFQNGSNRLYSMMSDMDRYSLHGNVELATNTAFSVGRERQSSRDRDDDDLSALIDGLKELKRQNNEPHGNTYIIDGITYDDGSNVANAIGALIRAAKVGGRA